MRKGKMEKMTGKTWQINQAILVALPQFLQNTLGLVAPDHLHH
jgi:hypothetical protein